MTLERLELDLFRGESRDIGSPQVFGGQVLGQALMAASGHGRRAATRTRCTPISCVAATSIRPSSTRSIGRATAITSPRAAWSPFSTARRSSTCPPRFSPLEERTGSPAADAARSRRRRRWTRSGDALEGRARDVAAGHAPRDRAKASVRVSPGRAAVLPQAGPRASRFGTSGFAPSTACPTTTACSGACSPTCPISICSTRRSCRTPCPLTRKLTMASIDHAMWFHRRARVDEWLLYATDSPSASGARGFARGSVFSRDGRLVASISQEGLLRVSE